MMAFTANTLNHVGYLCILGCLFYCSVPMAGIIYFHTYSTLVAAPASRVYTLGSDSFTLGSLVVSGLDDNISASFLVVLMNIVESYFREVIVLFLIGENGQYACGFQRLYYF